MAAKARRRRRDKPQFPRKQWQPGQQERIEKPRKGRGSYDRTRQKRDDKEEIM